MGAAHFLGCDYFPGKPIQDLQVFSAFFYRENKVFVLVYPH